MNRIYKSIYHAARRCVVCVSEIQSSRVKTKSEHKGSPVKLILSMLSSAVLMVVSSTSMAAPSIVMADIGGISYTGNGEDANTPWRMTDSQTSLKETWSYVIGREMFEGFNAYDQGIGPTVNMIATDFTLYKSLADTGVGNLTIEKGSTLNISGGSSSSTYAFERLSSDGGTAEIINEGTLTIQGGSGYTSSGIQGLVWGSTNTSTIKNIGTGTLTISGGTGRGAYGIEYTVWNDGTAVISNESEGDLIIQGGTGREAHGIATNVRSNGTVTITNIGSGSLTIQGGTGLYSTGIETNTYCSGCTGTISNTGAGTLTIQGATAGEGDAGIGKNSHTGTGIISNTGTGILLIQGGSVSGAYGIEENSNYGNAIITNTGTGTLMIQGGSYGSSSSGINYNGSFGTGIISNTGSGTLTIRGGESSHTYGIRANAERGTGIISNTGNGNLTIQGGSSNDAYGVRNNVYSNGGSGTISNTGSGTLTIQGGTAMNAYGVNSNNYYPNGTGTISNTGDGTLIVQGGTKTAASGIYSNASKSGAYSGKGLISNTGTGTLIIQAGSVVSASGIDFNANGSDSIGTISNTESGTLTIQGASNVFAYGIKTNAYDGGTGIVSNEGSGDLNIYCKGFDSNAEGSGSSGTIRNVGSGKLTISGGESDAIFYNAERGATGIIENIGSGTLTIQAGTRTDASGIHNNSGDESSSGTIRNGENGTLNILGNKDAGSYGIQYLAGGSSTSLLENSGLMNLNTNAIKRFVEYGTPASLSVVNKSSGTVNSEAGAIFESVGQIETTVNSPIQITIYTPSEGTKITELDSYSISEITVTTKWKLKNDWANYSTWEDGGKLIINDVVAGSAEAQTIIDSFQDRFGTGTTIEFTGTEVNTMSLNRDGESEKPDFSMWHVDELIVNGEIKNGSVVTSEVLQMTVNDDYGIVMPDVSEPLSEGNYDPGEYSLVIGNTGEGAFHEYVLSQDIGFKGLINNSGVTIKDGYSFTLVGEQAAMAMALRTTESQATFQLTDSPVTVQADSTLKLGIADLSATQGYFEDLTLADTSAALSVENGIFQITNVTGNGQIKVQEKGQLTIANKASAGEVVNNGVLTANTVNTQIGGSAAVATLADGDQNHFETFTNEKGGEANFADVTVAEGANVKNKADATINAGAVVLNGGAAITNFTDGTLNFDSFEMNGTLRNNGTINVTGEMTLAQGTSTTLAGKVTAGTFSIGRTAQKAQPASIMLMTEPRTAAVITGETYSDVLDLAGGDVAIRKDAILAGIELKDNIVNSHVTVDVDGTFAFSYNENQLKDALKDLKLDTDGKALVVLSTDLSFGENGSLTVGTTDATDTINLGSDALLLLGTDKLHGGAVLDGEGKESLNIKEGAVLAFTDDAIWGNHYIVSDFVSMDAAENLTVKDLEGNELKTHHNDKGIYITIGSNNILDKDVDFGLSNNINAIMDGMQDTTSSKADIRYLSMAMGAKDGVKQTNDLQHLSAQAGILSEAYRLTDNAHESIIRHAMSDKYANVWVEALAGKGGVDGAETGYSDASYDSDSYGMIFGVDGRIGSDINIGAAFHYQKGDLEADSSETKNEFKNYGASIYAGTNFGNLNVTAGITYAKGDHEFNQMNLGYVEGDTDTEIFMGGLRASYPFMLNRILITPYAGLEAVHVKEDGFTAKIGGAEAFDFGSVSETFGRVPMGVKFSGGNDRFAGFADISVIPQFGNRDAKQSVSGINTHAKDIAKFDYADSVLGRVKMGAAYQVTPSTTIGVSYGASMGDVRDLSHEFSLNAKYRF